MMFNGKYLKDNKKKTKNNFNILKDHLPSILFKPYSQHKYTTDNAESKGFFSENRKKVSMEITKIAMADKNN